MKLIAACPMALEIDKKPYAFLAGAEIPIEIGCNVKPCPFCGAPMSFAYDHYFCRKCGLRKTQEQRR